MQKKNGLLPGMTDASGALLAFRRVVGRRRRQPAAGKGLLHTVWIFVLCSCGDLAFPRGTFFAEAVTSQSSAEEQFNPALTEQAEEEEEDAEDSRAEAPVEDVESPSDSSEAASTPKLQEGVGALARPADAAVPAWAEEALQRAPVESAPELGMKDASVAPPANVNALSPLADEQTTVQTQEELEPDEAQDRAAAPAEQLQEQEQQSSQGAEVLQGAGDQDGNAEPAEAPNEGADAAAVEPTEQQAHKAVAAMQLGDAFVEERSSEPAWHVQLMGWVTKRQRESDDRKAAKMRDEEKQRKTRGFLLQAFREHLVQDKGLHRRHASRMIVEPGKNPSTTRLILPLITSFISSLLIVGMLLKLGIFIM